MKRAAWKLLLPRLFAVLLIAGFVPFSYSQQKAKLLDSMFAALQAREQFNGCVLVAEKGQVIYEKAFGYSDFYSKKKLTTNSLFELASVSKAFTAMGIMMLKERGLLDYADEVKKYVPQIPYDGITIRHLLTHTSGLPEYEPLFNQKWDKTRIAANDDIWTLLEIHKPSVNFKPGEQWRYSNTGYALLASVIEKVSGVSYGEYLQRNVFQPLNMERTRVHRRRYQPEPVSDYALGFTFSFAKGGYALPDSIENLKYVYYLDGIVGDGCVNSTVGDLLKWDRALYTDKLVSKETLEEAFTPATLNTGTAAQGPGGAGYGFGWGLENSSDGKIAAHGGGWPGYATLIVRLLDRDQTVIMLSNAESGRPDRNVIDILNNRPFSLPRTPAVIELRQALAHQTMAELSPRIEILLRDTATYRFDEGSINVLGYQLMQANRIDDAIDIFKLNVKLYPKSANVYDSLGEAYMSKGDKELAIANYEKSLQLEPKNEGAVSALKKLKAK